MFVGNVEIVKSPDNRIICALVRLDLHDHAFKEARVASVYLNPVKGAFEVLLCFHDGKFGFAGEFVGKASTDRAVPCEVQGASQIVNCIPGDERHLIQGPVSVRDFMFERLPASGVVLDRGSTSIFERDNSGRKVRDMFFGPCNLESRIFVNCTHCGSPLGAMRSQ